MRKLILRNDQSPGDIVMLTAAVRDLHRSYPGRYVTDARTDYPELWQNNPFITPLPDNGPGVQVIDCHYPLIHKSNDLPYHFLHGFIAFLNQSLGLSIQPTAFKGDIHLSEDEKAANSPLAEILGYQTPYWVVVGGGKFDFTIKWWDHARYQQVVDFFRGKIVFVQVGLLEHHHPPLQGVVDLRGKTTLRQLIRLIHHSQGVLCPVSLAMHLAAAVETKVDSPASRPCVVIAGGREPPHWEAYPSHQFIHTVGALKCCSTGGCWQSRTLPLGDGDKKDSPYKRCHFVVDRLPKCMDMITADDVIRRVQLYFEGGTLTYADAFTHASEC